MAPHNPSPKPSLFRFGPPPAYATFFQARGRRWHYTPKHDITLFDLAMILPLMAGIAGTREDLDIEEYLDRYQLRRHFREEG